MLLEPPILSCDALRISALRSYEILDSLPEEAYDGIVGLVAAVCRTPIALVSLVDESRLWFKSRVGLEASQIPRAGSFCARALENTKEILVVSDARADERFRDNPIVTDVPFMRFYAGIPLVSPDGFALGSLCVIDTVPRTLDAAQIETLRIAGHCVVGLLEERRTSLRLERALVEGRRTLRRLTLLENVAVHAHEGVIVLATPPAAGEVPRVEYANASFESLTGCAASSAWGRSMRELFEKIGQPPHMEAVLSAMREAVPQTIETPFWRSDGSSVMLELSLSPVVQARDETPEFWVLLLRDISDRCRAKAQEERAVSMSIENQELAREIERRQGIEERLSFAARHDALCGLPNRTFFLERLRERLRTRLATDPPFAVMFVDIDRFKHTNDTLGHMWGDDLLVTIARRLEGCVPVTDMVARFGGDEFAILVHALHGKNSLAQLGDRLARAVALSCPLGENDVVVSASIGILVATGSYASAEEVLRDADFAMFGAKARGGNRYEFFREALRQRVGGEAN